MPTIKAHCNACGGERNHSVLHESKAPWSTEYEGIGTMSGMDIYQMVQCLGCDAIRLRYEYEEYGQDSIITYYPPALARKEPEWFFDLLTRIAEPEKELIGDLLKEIYAALQSDSRWLAAIGIRSLLEHVMIKRSGDKGSFAKNLEAFMELGHVSKTQQKFLASVLEAGHASTHRGWRPSTKELSTLMDVTESVVEAVYVLEEKIALVKVPPRQPR
jgi:hypothetical protein